jgi:hypothetical protein
VIDVRPHYPRRFGTGGAFPNLFREVWKDEDHVFSAEGGVGMSGCTGKSLGHPDRTSSNVLNQYLVEILAVEDIPTGPGEKDWYWA